MPIGDIIITLTSETDLPENVALYTFEDGVADKQDPQRDGNEVRFPWRGELFLLTEASPEDEPAVTEEAPAETEPPATRSPEEERARRDGIALGIAGGVLALTGAGIFLLTRRRTKF